MTNTQSFPINRKKWTVDEFDRLTGLGAFASEKIEIIEGNLLIKAPQEERHVRAVLLMQYKFMQIFTQGYVVRVQLPLRLENSKPEPDVAVIAGNLRDPIEMPSTALLVVEIAHSTLQTDREVKS